MKHLIGKHGAVMIDGKVPVCVECGKEVMIKNTTKEKFLSTAIDKAYQEGFIAGAHETAEQANEIHAVEIAEVRKQTLKEVIVWTKRLDEDGCDWVSTKKMRIFLKNLNQKNDPK